MAYLLVGIVLFIGSFGGLWLSLPVGGQMRSHVQGGRDVWIAIVITTCIGLSAASLIVGISALVAK